MRDAVCSRIRQLDAATTVFNPARTINPQIADSCFPPPSPFKGALKKVIEFKPGKRNKPTKLVLKQDRPTLDVSWVRRTDASEALRVGHPGPPATPVIASERIL